MIQGLMMTPPVLGRIAIGKMVERNGKRLPEKDDEFTITTQVQNRAGWVLHPIDGLLRAQLAKPAGHVDLPASDPAVQQGTQERTLFFVESGSLSVHFEDEKQRIRLAIVGAGSIVGEGAFFSHQPRNATVQAVAGCRLWGLSSIRFTELCNRQPTVAVALAMAAGSVLAKRLGNRKRRVAAT